MYNRYIKFFYLLKVWNKLQTGFTKTLSKVTVGFAWGFNPIALKGHHSATSNEKDQDGLFIMYF